MNVGEYFEQLRTRNVTVILGECESAIADYFQGLGFDVVDIKGFDFQAENDVFVVSNTQASSDYMIDHIFGNHNCHCAHINPWKLYGNSVDGIKYTFDRILESDVDTALQQRDELNHIIRSKLSKNLLITRGHSVVRAEFIGPVEITNTDRELRRGWNYSIAEFLEIGLLNFGDTGETGFVVSGEMSFDGIVGFRPRVSTSDSDPLVKELLLAVDNSTDKLIYINDNVITALKLDGSDFTDLLHSCFSEDWQQPELREEIQLKEIAFGCNHLEKSRVNWVMNALTNEGLAGFHLGFGLADKASHFDFVCHDDYNLSW